MDITVTSSNSPYPIAGPSANYATVTIQTGGYLVLQSQTMLTIKALVKK